jgi:adenylate cyclase
VLVIWSADAAKSQWVRAEADAARELGTLVQVTVDGTMPPLPFNQIQCASLPGDGQIAGPGWDKLRGSLATLVKGEAAMTASEPATARKKRMKSICILPFQNMSGDAEQEYFSDGISEDITTDLSKISALAVTARNTAFQFKGRSVDVSEVAVKLGVSHVLEGSVRKAGDRVRISAQLIDGGSGDHVWAERYDRELTDIFAIQDEISKAIVDALKIKLLPAEKKAIEDRGTSDAEAYNLFLMARQFWRTGNYGDVRRDRIVVRTTERAVELDPSYGKAWALMAIAQASLRYHHGLVGDDGLAAAERALALDPTIAEAYAVRARHLGEDGDFAAAEAEIQKGFQLDPNSWDLVREAARLAMAQRKVRLAKEYYRQAAALDKTDFHSPMMLTTCYFDEGDHDGVRSAAQLMLERSERAIAQDPLNASAIGIAAGALALVGRVEEAREKHRRAMLIDPDNVNMPYNFACVLAAWLGEIEAALDLIEPLFARVSASLILGALADPDMDRLRDHPRFIAAAKAAIIRTGLTSEMLPEAARNLAIS